MVLGPIPLPFLDGAKKSAAAVEDVIREAHDVQVGNSLWPNAEEFGKSGFLMPLAKTIRQDGERNSCRSSDPDMAVDQHVPAISLHGAAELQSKLDVRAIRHAKERHPRVAGRGRDVQINEAEHQVPGPRLAMKAQPASCVWILQREHSGKVPLVPQCPVQAGDGDGLLGVH